MKWRKYHRIVSLIVFLPLLVVVLTGILLLWRQQLEWVQPAAVVSAERPGMPLLSMEKIVAISGKNSALVEQVIWKPNKFQMVVRLKDGTEMQVHPQTGEVLKSAPRLTQLLIELHQGSFFTTGAQYGIFFPSALGLLFLIISGLIIYPWRRKHEH